VAPAACPAEGKRLTAAAFCRRERVSVSLWKCRQRKIEREATIVPGAPPLRPEMPFAAVEIIPRRAVFLRFPGGATIEIPDDRVDLVRLAIERLAAASEAGPC
jgi:hypothetical protein